MTVLQSYYDFERDHLVIHDANNIGAQTRITRHWRRPEHRADILQQLDRMFPDGYTLPSDFDYYFSKQVPLVPTYGQAIEMFAMAAHEAGKRREREGQA